MDILIYSKKNCPHCVTAIKAAQAMVQEGAGEVTILKVDESEELREQLLTEVPNARTLPQVFVDGRHIGGADKFLEWITVTNGGKLQQL